MICVVCLLNALIHRHTGINYRCCFARRVRAASDRRAQSGSQASHGRDAPGRRADQQPSAQIIGSREPSARTASPMCVIRAARGHTCERGGHRHARLRAAMLQTDFRDRPREATCIAECRRQEPCAQGGEAEAPRARTARAVRILQAVGGHSSERGARDHARLRAPVLQTYGGNSARQARCAAVRDGEREIPIGSQAEERAATLCDP